MYLTVETKALDNDCIIIITIQNICKENHTRPCKNMEFISSVEHISPDYPVQNNERISYFQAPIYITFFILKMLTWTFKFENKLVDSMLILLTEVTFSCVKIQYFKPEKCNASQWPKIAYNTNSYKMNTNSDLP